jgi:hypothetical protein
MRRVPHTTSAAMLLLLCLTAMARCARAEDKPDELWNKVQQIVGRVHGISTAPPANLETPKFTTGALMGNGDIGVVAGDPDPSRQTFRFGKSDFWGTHWNNGHHATEVSILSFGRLTISSPETAPDTSTAAYRMDQDVLHAQVSTTLVIGGRVVHMRSWTADNANVFVTEIHLDKTAAGSGTGLPMRIELAMPLPNAAPHVTLPASAGQANGIIWVSRENDLTAADAYKARGAVAVYLLGAKLSGIAVEAASVTGTFQLTDAAPVLLVSTFASDARIGQDGPTMTVLARKAVQQAARISVADVTAMQRVHERWWKQFWMRSLVDLHDEVLEDFYYGSLYLLGCSSRPGKLAPSLWGNFVTTDNAEWGGRYFMNYNEEAPFYGVFSSNHADLAEPYNRMVLAQLPWQKNRTAEAGYEGVSYQRSFSPFTVIAASPALVPVATVKDYTKLPSDQKSNATFSFLPVIQYWEYTQDKAFLSSQLYPALRELDAFWRDFAVHDASEEHWIFEHTSAHEGGDDVDPNLDLGFAHRIEKELIETSQILHVDADLRPVWKSFSEQLAPYPQGAVDGKPVYFEAARVKGDSSPSRLFIPGDQPINLEGLVFPGENLAIGEAPTQLEVARNSLEEMQSWGVTKGGNSHNGFCKIFAIAARVGWPADDLIAKFTAAIQYDWRPSNVTDFQGGGGIETAGSIEAIDSMLLQHEGGVLRVFPDWPMDRDASFRTLRAKGAFLVSSELLEGKVRYIDFVSGAGGPLVIASPWGSQGVRLAGREGTLKAEEGMITLQTVSGAHYYLTAVDNGIAEAGK